MPDLLFLGHRGTYSEVGAKKALGFLGEDYILRPVSTIPKIIDLINKTPDLLGVLPFENSIEGIVRPTIDNIYLSNVKIVAEIDIKIEHCLLSRFSDKTKIKHIISHPQALAQCQKYIVENFDEDIDLIPEASTARAANNLLDKDEHFHPYIVATRCGSDFLNTSYQEPNMDFKTFDFFKNKNKI